MSEAGLMIKLKILISISGQLILLSIARALLMSSFYVASLLITRINNQLCKEIHYLN